MKVISFINMKGGVGKSTVAINVAHCLSERNEKRVLIIDMDPQFNATQCVLTPEAYIKHMESGGDTICTVFNPERVVVNSINGSSIVKPKEGANKSPNAKKRLCK
ncbi:TPA: ParA family protein [Enterobacter asburiae]